MSEENNNELSLTGLEIPIVLSVFALIFWNSIAVLPVKLMTVFFHELSHALAAILTGGKVIRLGLHLNEGGETLTVGGISIIILSAGYLGSLFWGSGILLLSLKKGINRGLTIALGILMTIVTLVWIRSLDAIAITLSLAAFLIFISLRLKEEYCSIIIKTISLISCFYVVFDIKDNLIDKSVSISDASKISKMIFPGFMQTAGGYIIGFLWFIIAIFVLWKVFKYALDPNRK